MQKLLVCSSVLSYYMNNDKEYFKRYLVILADRQKGRFFTIFMNTFEDQGEKMKDEDVPQKVKAEGFRVAKIGRHIKDHLYRHLKHVCKSALNYLISKRIKQIDGVVLCSHEELFPYLRKFLPSKLRDKVILEIVSKVNVPIGDLTNKIVHEVRQA